MIIVLKIDLMRMKLKSEMITEKLTHLINQSQQVILGLMHNDKIIHIPAIVLASHLVLDPVIKFMHIYIGE
jgi:hypothetical protein